VVCPGIRLLEDTPVTGIKDQARIVTPGEAAHRGADYIVLGRPIIQALDPITVLEKVKKEIETKKTKN
jgi:orotidine-5'-phosphate decarboxylase